IDAASKFGDTWDNIKSSITAFGQSLIAQLMPAFQTVMDWVIEKMPAIQSTIGGVLSWLSEKGQSIFGTIQQAVQDNELTLNRLRDTATDVG
ncbi:hypothetical protein CVR96_27440, partial [Salmonella enterica subsp. enterica serovar Typhimurium]|uniref:hypothetical protein n=1 Tax=Salmonella enterica TaxID=28901 RepID=UPI000CC735EF